MKMIPRALVLLSLGVALAGCAKTDKAGEAASADNVEMPAEEALSGVDAVPSADPSAASSEAATEEAASAEATSGEAASAAGSAASADKGPARPEPARASSATDKKM